MTMHDATAKRARPALTAKVEKFAVNPARLSAVFKSHGHTIRSATALKEKLDRQLQLSHAGGK
jgi:hypothetical protein